MYDICKFPTDEYTRITDMAELVRFARNSHEHSDKSGKLRPRQPGKRKLKDRTHYLPLVLDLCSDGLAHLLADNTGVIR